MGAVAAALTAGFGRWPFGPAVGWDATAVVFTATVWLGIWPLSAHTTAKRATRGDPSRATSDILTLCACVASLAAAGGALVSAHHPPGRGAALPPPPPGPCGRGSSLALRTHLPRG